MSSETITRNDLMAILNEVLPSPSFMDIFYPVGSYYETSDASFDPNTSWGGTWVLEAEGQVHVSAGTGYSIGSTGGNETHHHSTGDHKLTTSEIPAHTHGNKSLEGNISVRRFGTSGTGEDILLGGSGYTDGIVSRSTPTWSGTHGLINATNRSQSNPIYDKAHINASHEHSSVGGNGTHNHGNTGDGSNMQPYIVVNRWHRTA